MKLTKESKIVNLNGYACGYYSGAEAKAQVFLPLEFYEQYKEKIDRFEYSVGELDGKHSQCDMDIKADIINVLDYWDCVDNECEYNGSFSENLAYDLKDDIECKEVYRLLDSFESALKSVPKLFEKEVKNIKNTTELCIENEIIPIGSEIQITITKHKTIANDWSVEY